MKTDFLVIGSGAAGLSFALKAAAHGHVTIVTKGEIEECNTNYAQGGICSVTYAPDTFEKHIRDTLVCGAGKCDEKAVELVQKHITARKIMTWEAIENAIMVLMAVGGSTNAVIHTCAIAYELGFAPKKVMEAFDKYSGIIPHIAAVDPASLIYDCEDLYKAGGIPEVMKSIRKSCTPA